MAAVGVALFPYVTGSGKSEGPPALESLLLDLLSASLSQLSTGTSAGHVTPDGGHVTYTHTLIQTIASTGAPHLKKAVILSLPLLLRSVTGYCGTALSADMKDRVMSVATCLFHCFNAYVLYIITLRTCHLMLTLQCTQLVYIISAESGV